MSGCIAAPGHGKPPLVRISPFNQNGAGEVGYKGKKKEGEEEEGGIYYLTAPLLSSLSSVLRHGAINEMLKTYFCKGGTKITQERNLHYPKTNACFIKKVFFVEKSLHCVMELRDPK